MDTAKQSTLTLPPLLYGRRYCAAKFLPPPLPKNRLLGLNAVTLEAPALLSIGAVVYPSFVGERGYNKHGQVESFPPSEVSFLSREVEPPCREFCSRARGGGRERARAERCMDGLLMAMLYVGDSDW